MHYSLTLKKRLTFLCFAFVTLSQCAFSAEPCSSTTRLAPYKDYLEHGTYAGNDFSFFSPLPKSRYYTLQKVFEYFEANKGKVVVELGTTRSFVDGRFEGCNDNNPKYWEPTNPSKWDWGAGCFTYLVAKCLGPLNIKIYTVDLMRDHIQRCKVITQPFSNLISYNICSSVHFLRNYNSHNQIDLLYLDTGDITPIEPTARLHLQEARIIVRRNLIAPGGIILIDDVKHPAPIRIDHDKSGLGKAKYSIPYFLNHGFELIDSEFQYILRRKN
ncbi:MAG: hypothetical protein P0S95_03820 [Rhabdochlamydiaceae bacterium]|nr:hypothetical protein [Candidatus Amphrikana amoebophyrae]